MGFFEDVGLTNVKDIALNVGTAGLYGAGKWASRNGGKLRSITGTEKFKPDQSAGDINGYDESRQRLLTGAENAGGRTAVQLDGAPQDAVRNQQSGLAAALQRQANGEGPSVAQGQLQQATNRNLAQALAMQASQRGAGQAGALRAIAGQQAQISQQAASDSSQLRMQEQLGAQNQLGQILAGQRGQDLAFAGENAGLEMQQRGLNDSLTQFYTNQGLSLDQAQMQARLQLEQLRAGNFAGTQKARADLFGKVLGGAGQAAGLGAG